MFENEKFGDCFRIERVYSLAFYSHKLHNTIDILAGLRNSSCIVAVYLYTALLHTLPYFTHLHITTTLHRYTTRPLHHYTTTPLHHSTTTPPLHTLTPPLHTLTPPLHHYTTPGCVHSHPEHVERIYKALVGLGVTVNPNTFSGKAYPYKPQGIAVIQQID